MVATYRKRKRRPCGYYIELRTRSCSRFLRTTVFSQRSDDPGLPPHHPPRSRSNAEPASDRIPDVHSYDGRAKEMPKKLARWLLLYAAEIHLRVCLHQLVRCVIDCNSESCECGMMMMSLKSDSSASPLGENMAMRVSVGKGSAAKSVCIFWN